MELLTSVFQALARPGRCRQVSRSYRMARFAFPSRSAAMWFKNLQLHRLPAPWAVTPAQLEKWLAPHAFEPGNTVEMQAHGWAAPRDDGALVYSTNRQKLLVYRAAK